MVEMSGCVVQWLLGQKLYNFPYCSMAETDVLSEFADNKMQTISEQDSNYKLPRIQKPFSRGNARSKAEIRKTPPLFPNIRLSANHVLPEQYMNLEQPNEPEKDGFALDIEQKLKMVLQNVNQGQPLQEDLNSGSQFDFQEIVNQNRQHLQQQKQRNENNNHTNNLMERQQREHKPKSKTIKTVHRNDNLIEKRMREYRDATSENKYLQKKKDLIAVKHEAAEKIKAKLKEETSSNSKTTPRHANQSQPAILKPIRPKLSAKPQDKHQEAKSANLFDNIHNFLENPHKNRGTGDIRRVSKANIKILQEKIKSINDKLGVSEQLETKSAEEIKEIQRKTVLDWKRMDYSRGSNLRCFYDSNFEKEIDKIGSLQERNSLYLNKFLEHQKTLVELTLLKKMHVKGP